MKKVLIAALALACLSAQAANTDGTYHRRGVKGKTDANLVLLGQGGTYLQYRVGTCGQKAVVEVKEATAEAVTLLIRKSQIASFCSDETVSLKLKNIDGQDFLGDFKKQ